MKPAWPVVTSLMYVTSPVLVSVITTIRMSPGFIINVFAFGVMDASVCCPGPGGPVGTPSVCRNAKLTGSMHDALNPALSMLSAAHHCVGPQLMCRLKGGQPGG